MTSAFGIDHGVISKSQFRPGEFKAITELDPLMRRKISRRLTEGYHTGYGPVRGQSSAGRKIWGSGPTRPDTPSAKGHIVLNPVKAERVDRGATSGRSVAAAQFNGRGGGVLHVSPEGNNPLTLTHEMAHMAPRRNPWRWQQRAKNVRVQGREEGRADFIAHGGPSTGKYGASGTQDPEFTLGYNEVQLKMNRARRRKQQL